VYVHRNIRREKIYELIGPDARLLLNEMARDQYRWFTVYDTANRLKMTLDAAQTVMFELCQVSFKEADLCERKARHGSHGSLSLRITEFGLTVHRMVNAGCPNYVEPSRSPRVSKRATG